MFSGQNWFKNRLFGPKNKKPFSTQFLANWTTKNYASKQHVVYLNK
jgi:hypothetical protein